MLVKKLSLILSIAVGVSLAACSSNPSQKSTETQVDSNVQKDAQGNKVLHLNFKQAVDNGIQSGVLDKNIRFYLAGAGAPGKVIKSGLISNRRTNAVGKTSEEACQRALHSALIQFQKQARSLGANKVTGLVSYYRKDTYSSPKFYECHVGNVMVAVTLKGNISK